MDLEKLFNECAKKYGITSGNAYRHLFDNHSHPLGDESEDMVTFEVALEALRIAEKEAMKSAIDCVGNLSKIENKLKKT